MSNLEELEKTIDELPEEDYRQFRLWFLERDWERWDRQIGEDSRAGKLNFLYWWLKAQDRLSSARREVLLKLRNFLERIKIHLMLAREVQAFNSKNAFSQATQLVIDLSRQNEGWLKSTA